MRISDWSSDVCSSDLIAAAKAYATERRQIEAKIPQEFLRAPKGSAWPTHMPSFETANAIAEARRLNAAWPGRNLPSINVAQIHELVRRLMVWVSQHLDMASQIFDANGRETCGEREGRCCEV